MESSDTDVQSTFSNRNASRLTASGTAVVLEYWDLPCQLPPLMATSHLVRAHGWPPHAGFGTVCVGSLLEKSGSS